MMQSRWPRPGDLPSLWRYRQGYFGYFILSGQFKARDQPRV